MSAAPNGCSLDGDHCLSLEDILVAFSAPIGEEHAWAVCHQCAKCFKHNWQTVTGCTVVTQLGQVLIHRDGHVHPNTLVGRPKSPTEDESDTRPSEQTLVAGLGLVLFKALDFGLEEDEERHLSPELTALIQNMTGSGSGERAHQCETDDEGIERDSEEEHHNTATLSRVLQECTVHLGSGGAQEAESHYRAVCRALVAEALELSSFLERVAPPSIAVLATTPTSATQLATLNFNDWARLWVQVIRELRRGVQLKKVCYSRKPIEYELTPYEILMEDIRARRYQLRKVGPPHTADIPHNLKKDAHAIILEFIRSRPPLRKASERKLPPPLTRSTTPRERLMESIKQGHAKLRASPRRTETRLDDPVTIPTPNTTKSTRRLIKVDFSALPMDDDDEDEDDDEDLEDRVDKAGSVGPADTSSRGVGPASRTNQQGANGAPTNRWQRTGSRRLSSAQIHEYFDTALQSYDLATQCPRSDWAGGRRRNTVVVCPSGSKGSWSLPQSRPDSRQTDTPSEESIATTLPEMTWSRSSLQDDLLHSKQWQEECLSLTLEEIVHIRSVLTKAELESLPVEGHVKEDAEKRKVCFLCMKTRFGIFGPWGQVCKLCKRTVCAKCYSKMRIPTEHFSHVPVVALSPNLLSPCDSDDSFPRALVTKLMSGSPPGGSANRMHGGVASGEVGGVRKGCGTVGSAPSSPKLHRSAPPSQMSTSLFSDGPVSLPSSSPAYTSPSDKWRLAREKALGRRGGGKAEKLKGLQMTVCHDCKTMVLQIIKSSRTTRNNAIRNLTLDLSPVY